MDPATATLLITTISSIGGVGMSAYNAHEDRKALVGMQNNQPAVPSEQDATAKAKEEQLRQRRALLQSGGITDYTGGSAVLNNKNVMAQTLLGG